MANEPKLNDVLPNIRLMDAFESDSLVSFRRLLHE